MVEDKAIQRAVSNIKARAERQENDDAWRTTFVDLGILTQLDNPNNQIFYGRRGTGKTHAFKALGLQLEADISNLVVYIDARILGSSAQYTDEALPVNQRCFALFKDILLAVYHSLYQKAFNVEIGEGELAEVFVDLGLLEEALVLPFTTLHKDNFTESTEESPVTKRGGSLTADIGNKVAVQGEAEKQTASKTTRSSTLWPWRDRTLFRRL